MQTTSWRPAIGATFFAGAAAGQRCCRLRRARATPEAMAAAIKQVTGDAAIRERPGRRSTCRRWSRTATPCRSTVSVESPMTEADHVKAIHVFNEKNPQPHVFDARARPAQRQGA